MTELHSKLLELLWCVLVIIIIIIILPHYSWAAILLLQLQMREESVSQSDLNVNCYHTCGVAAHSLSCWDWPLVRGSHGGPKTHEINISFRLVCDFIQLNRATSNLSFSSSLSKSLAAEEVSLGQVKQVRHFPTVKYCKVTYRNKGQLKGLACTNVDGRAAVEWHTGQTGIMSHKYSAGRCHQTLTAPTF